MRANRIVVLIVLTAMVLALNAFGTQPKPKQRRVIDDANVLSRNLLQFEALTEHLYIPHYKYLQNQIKSFYHIGTNHP